MSILEPTPAPPRAAVVGGGIVGASIAWRLALQGWQVVLLDKGEIGNEASWAGAGMLAPGGEFEEPSEIARLALESRALYSAFIHDLENESSHRIDYQEFGALELAYSAEEWQRLRDKCERQKQLGIVSRPLDAQQVSVLWPFVSQENLHGACFFPDDGLVAPRDVVTALKIACVNRSVEIRDNTDVLSIDLTTNPYPTINTPSDSLTVQAVVLAAGAWSSTIEIIGVSQVPAVVPIKGQLIAYQQPSNVCGTILRHGHTYLIQRQSGTLIVGATVEHAGFDRAVSDDAVEQLHETAARILPHLRETRPADSWIGFRPGSDSLQIGRWQDSALYLAYGHFRNGILLAPLTAERIAKQVTSNWQTKQAESFAIAESVHRSEHGA